MPLSHRKPQKILIDAGAAAYRIEQSLMDLGASMDEINAILITHEHIDHVEAPGAFPGVTIFPFMPRIKYGRNILDSVIFTAKIRYNTNMV